MFRTRDFFLLFLTIVFLVIAIGTTLWAKRPDSSASFSGGLPVGFVDAEDVDYVATIPPESELDREGRIASMKEKIAQGNGVTISGPETIEEDSLNEDEDEDGEDEVLNEVVEGVRACAGYSNFSGHWPAIGVKSEMSEGARLIYVDSIVTNEGVMGASSTGASKIKKDVFLQLSLTPLPVKDPFCIASDVIGVAKDGSLIRNNEAGLYGLFGEDTLVGYALDGYPIYGSTSLPLDECGGENVNGNYGYYVSADDEEILNCFWAKPVSL